MAGVKTHDGVTLFSPNGLQQKLLTVDNSGNPLFDGSQLATNVYAAGLDIGVNQTYQDVSGSRAIGSTYTNSTGKPILVRFEAVGSTTGAFVNLLVSGVIVGHSSNSYATSAVVHGMFIVPPGATYGVTLNYGTFTSILWVELR